MCQRVNTCIGIVGCIIGCIKQFAVFILYLILTVTFVHSTSRCIAVAFVGFVKQVIDCYTYINRFQPFQFESISETQVANTVGIQRTIFLMSIV